MYNIRHKNGHFDLNNSKCVLKIQCYVAILNPVEKILIKNHRS